MRNASLDSVLDAVPQARTAAPYAVWALRLVLGAVFIQHVMRIVFGYEPADPTQLFGLPPGASWFGVAWNFVIGLALIYGLWPRLAALAGAATLSMAIVTGHGGSAFAWQLPGFWTAALLIFAIVGDGAFAMVPSGSAFHREHRA